VPLRGITRGETGHGLEVAQGPGQGFGPEKHPGHHDHEHGVDMRHQTRPLGHAFAQRKAFDDRKQAVEHPPNDEIPARPVPQAAQEKHRHQVAVELEGALPIAAEGNIQIVAKPGGQGNVPPAPELLDGPGNIGIIEVFHELEPEHVPKADGHVRVAGKIEINLQGVAQDAEPGHRGGKEFGRNGEDLVRRQGYHIGDEHLFAQPDDEPAYPFGKPLHAHGSVEQLVRDILIPDDGAGHELGKQRDIQGRRRQGALGRRLPPVNVHDVGNAVEREKRNADGQVHAPDRKLRPTELGKHQIQVGDKKIGVFEDDEQK